MKALMSPLCFGARDRRKILGMLQRIDEAGISTPNDPLWSRRHELTFAEGIRENSDYEVMGQLIEEYHRSGMGTRAVALRVLSGELMGRETVSFRERLNWSWDNFRDNLRRDVERAGLESRLPAI
jgi:hypothetical protein